MCLNRFERKETYIMFKCDHGDGNVITMKMPGEVSWPEAMDNFKNFLKGVGYFIPEEGCICNNPIHEDEVNLWVDESAEDTETEVGICDDSDDTVQITVSDGVPT
jgi:hypothetical protein